MAFFDNLTRKAQDVASVAGEKAKMAADTAKINMQSASEQRENHRRMVYGRTCG